jgi:hypothetical protein
LIDFSGDVSIEVGRCAPNPLSTIVEEDLLHPPLGPESLLNV